MMSNWRDGLERQLLPSLKLLGNIAPTYLSAVLFVDLSNLFESELALVDRTRRIAVSAGQGTGTELTVYRIPKSNSGLKPFRLGKYGTMVVRSKHTNLERGFFAALTLARSCGQCCPNLSYHQ